MDCLTIAILGDSELGRELGKKGTDSDLTFYNRKEGDRIYTFIHPKQYPDKIQGLIQSINDSNVVLLVVNEINAQLGEIILVLSALNVKKGLYIVKPELEYQFDQIIKGTIVENYEKVGRDFNTIFDKLSTIQVERTETPKIAVVDHYFDVRSVGTVVLGIVKQGCIHVHDKLSIQPLEKEVVIRSIQIHDKDVPDAPTGSRFGFALRGVKVDEFERGYVLTDDKDIVKHTEIVLDFEKNSFYSGEVKQGGKFHMAIGLQINPIEIVKYGEQLVVKCEKPFAAKKGDTALLLDLNAKKIRLIGKGIVR